MSVITIAQSGQNIAVAQQVAQGVVTLTENSAAPTVLTLNQGQQGPAGVSIYVDNYGDNRLVTSNGQPGGLYAENALTFNGSTLAVSGIPVSLSGHGHTIGEIINGTATVISIINNWLATQVSGALTGLLTIPNVCDTDRVVIQTSDNTSYTINIEDFMTAVSTVDGGGVSYSGC